MLAHVLLVLAAIGGLTVFSLPALSDDLFPHRGDLTLPAGTTRIPNGVTTGIEDGDLYIPVGATLHLEANSTFVWNPGHSIITDGAIVTDEGARLRKGYLCASWEPGNTCWSDLSFSDSDTCPEGSIRWKDVSHLPACGTAVHFTDPNLEAAIREAIGKPTGDIEDTDLLGLTYLDAGDRGDLTP